MGAEVPTNMTKLSVEELGKHPNIKPLFPYFGSKAKVAKLVWDALGDVDSYIEPFFGSGAVLMRRPHVAGGRKETVNDANGYVANFWRAVRMDPDHVAEFCDWPCNEIDLFARHVWLVNRMAKVHQKMLADPYYFDAKAAGWWCWGLTWWIGGGWCDGRGPWNIVDDRVVNIRKRDSDGRGAGRQRPQLGNEGQGVSRKRPQLGDEGKGVKRQLPHIGCDGRSVSRRRPQLADDVHGQSAEYSALVRSQVLAASDRLRRVRVCCGDWIRVCGSGVGHKPSGPGTFGVFLDPPYSDEAGRSKNLYATDCGKVAHDVREWCKSVGEDRRMRIVLAGYDGEHNELEGMGWRVIAWKTNGGMSIMSHAATRAKANSSRERLWLSPHTEQSPISNEDKPHD